MTLRRYYLNIRLGYNEKLFPVNIDAYFTCAFLDEQINSNLHDLLYFNFHIKFWTGHNNNSFLQYSFKMRKYVIFLNPLMKGLMKCLYN